MMTLVRPSTFNRSRTISWSYRRVNLHSRDAIASGHRTCTRWNINVKVCICLAIRWYWIAALRAGECKVKRSPSPTYTSISKIWTNRKLWCRCRGYDATNKLPVRSIYRFTEKTVVTIFNEVSTSESKHTRCRRSCRCAKSVRCGPVAASYDWSRSFQILYISLHPALFLSSLCSSLPIYLSHRTRTHSRTIRMFVSVGLSDRRFVLVSTIDRPWWRIERVILSKL